MDFYLGPPSHSSFSPPARGSRRPSSTRSPNNKRRRRRPRKDVGDFQRLWLRKGVTLTGSVTLALCFPRTSKTTNYSNDFFCCYCCCSLALTLFRFFDGQTVRLFTRANLTKFYAQFLLNLKFSYLQTSRLLSRVGRPAGRHGDGPLIRKGAQGVETTNPADPILSIKLAATRRRLAID